MIMFNHVNSLFAKQSMKTHINLYIDINVLLALFQKVPKP